MKAGTSLYRKMPNFIGGGGEDRTPDLGVMNLTKEILSVHPASSTFSFLPITKGSEDRFGL
jgi:hypothetical protein